MPDQNRKIKQKKEMNCLRLSPDDRLCPKFDAFSIALYPIASREDMGLRVEDDCAEEHIM